MDRPYQNFAADTQAQRIIDSFSELQFLHPHMPLAQVASRAAEEIGFTASAAQASLQSLQLSPTRPIGRLRRAELLQLARTIHRQWRQGVAEWTAQSQPA